jgi:crossover junction endodeoxyribonuclease RusA
MLTVTLPWPNRLLSPNVPGHWAAKAKAKKAYRTACKRIVDETEGAMPSMPPDGAVRVSMRFCPPDKRHRDLDNLMASMKSGLDGLADALGVNDSVFRPSVDWGQPVAGGQVVLTLEVIA